MADLELQRCCTFLLIFLTLFSFIISACLCRFTLLFFFSFFFPSYFMSEFGLLDFSSKFISAATLTGLNALSLNFTS